MADEAVLNNILYIMNAKNIKKIKISITQSGNSLRGVGESTVYSILRQNPEAVRQEREVSNAGR